MSVNLTGACHCRSVRVRFQSSKPPAELQLSTCTCGFCRRHGSRMAADPGGRMEIRADLGAILRYKFETRSADYVLCNRCGSYVAQVMEDPNTNVAVGMINVNCLDDQEAFQQPAIRIEPLIEPVAMRREKRAKTWTPCSFMR